MLTIFDINLKYTHPDIMLKFYLIYELMVNVHMESLKEIYRVVWHFVNENFMIQTTERNSSSASFRSCIRRRSRALIDRRSVLCFRSPTLLVMGIDCNCCCSRVFEGGVSADDNEKFQRGVEIELFAI